MAFTTTAKAYLNKLLGLGNLRVDSLTNQRMEDERLRRVESLGQFEGPVFPVPDAFLRSEFLPVLEQVKSHWDDFRGLQTRPQSELEFSFANAFFSSPDAEVLYAMVRHYRPRRIIEVGSGNSTRLIRSAIRDGRLATELVSIDPAPRRSVSAIADRVIAHAVEERSAGSISAELAENDILFIDSSHIVETGGDVVFLYLQVIPQLAPGVVVHVHDIFLPYEYPKPWVVEHRWGFNEQYLVQALLACGDKFDVLWAGHYLQRTVPKFSDYFPLSTGGQASSLWLRLRS